MMPWTGMMQRRQKQTDSQSTLEVTSAAGLDTRDKEKERIKDESQMQAIYPRWRWVGKGKRSLFTSLGQPGENPEIQ